MVLRGSAQQRRVDCASSVGRATERRVAVGGDRSIAGTWGEVVRHLEAHDKPPRQLGLLPPPG
jgi:hypothetical protein